MRIKELIISNAFRVVNNLKTTPNFQDMFRDRLPTPLKADIFLEKRRKKKLS